MNQLDYLELPKALNNYSGEVNKLIAQVEKTLIEKAEFISRKMSEADSSTMKRLQSELTHVQTTASMMDQMKLFMRFIETTVNDTREDFWSMAMDGSELKEELELVKDAYSKSLIENKTMLELNLSLTRKLRNVGTNNR